MRTVTVSYTPKHCRKELIFTSVKQFAGLKCFIIIMRNPLTKAPLIAPSAGKTPRTKEIAKTTQDAKCARLRDINKGTLNANSSQNP